MTFVVEEVARIRCDVCRKEKEKWLDPNNPTVSQLEWEKVLKGEGWTHKDEELHFCPEHSFEDYKERER